MFQLCAAVQAFPGRLVRGPRGYEGVVVPGSRAMSHAAHNLILEHREVAAVAATSAMFCNSFPIGWVQNTGPVRSRRSGSRLSPRRLGLIAQFPDTLEERVLLCGEPSDRALEIVDHIGMDAVSQPTDQHHVASHAAKFSRF